MQPWLEHQRVRTARRSESMYHSGRSSVEADLLGTSRELARRHAGAGKLRSPRYLDELRDGLPLSREGACLLLRCPDDEFLPPLLAAALEALNSDSSPASITYSRKVFIPLTNLCRDYCGYCTFRRDPGEPGAHTMTPDQVMEVAHAGEKMGCTEALFSLGDKPELMFPEMRETPAPPGLQLDFAISRGHVRTGAARDDPAAASQPRAAERRVDHPPGSGFAQHGPDAGDDEHCPALRPAPRMTTLPTRSRLNACAPSKKRANSPCPSPPVC